MHVNMTKLSVRLAHLIHPVAIAMVFRDFNEIALPGWR